MTTKQLIGFNITGEAITCLARDFFIEGDLRQAEQFLKNATTTITQEEMIAVLLGNAKIVGDSRTDTLDLADDVCEKHKELVRFLYSGIVKYKRKYFRPYAIVDNWGPRDVGSGYLYGRVAQGVKSLYQRNCEYMNNPKEDEVFILEFAGQERVVLWEQVQAPPTWISVVEDGNWQTGLNNFAATGGTLRVTGYTQKFPRDNYVSVYSLPKPEKKTEPEVEKPVTVSKYIDLKAVPDNQLKDKTNGYILTDGRFFACQYFEHKELAKEIIKRIYKQEVTDPEKQADDLNLLGIHESITGGFNCFIKRKPTGKQKDTFMMWCMYHDEDPKQLSNWSGE